MKKILLLAFFAVLIGGGAMLYNRLDGANSVGPSFRLQPATRGELLVTVSATGTVEPEEVVDVGAQVMGRISELGADPRAKSNAAFKTKHVDYGSPVEEGMVLAQIDRSLYQAQFNQASASLAQAKANVMQMEAKLKQADADWKRAQRLQTLEIGGRSPTGSARAESTLPIKGISDADFVLALANAESAKANVEAARAAVLQQEASLDLARTNLEYTTIHSPVNGTIIDRRVNIGQTVVASLNAPSLFLIAKDLRRMEVWASVNEADIGRLKEGASVTFRVDAFPDDQFHGVVSQVRLNASMTQNVVIYTVVISVDNSDLRLLPYLTADVKFEVDRREDALLVSNAALRFEPTSEQIAPTETAMQDEATSESDSRDSNAIQNDRRRSVDGDAADTNTKPRDAAPHPATTIGTVWIVDDVTKLARPIAVQTGLTDGTVTEIVGGDLKEGMELIVGELSPQDGARTAGSGDTVNPFAPPRFPGRRSGGSRSGGSSSGGSSSGGTSGGQTGGTGGAGRPSGPPPP